MQTVLRSIGHSGAIMDMVKLNCSPHDESVIFFCFEDEMGMYLHVNQKKKKKSQDLFLWPWSTPPIILPSR